MTKFDLIVAGGGLTGVASAVAAAREGLRVLLIEQSGCLGGAMSNNLVYPFMRYWTEDESGERKWLSTGLFREMRERVERYAATDRPGDFSPVHFQFVLDDLVTEAGVEVLFHATLFRIQIEGRRIRAVTLATKAGEMTLEADFFIDATGDGDLFAFAGCDFQLGRESDGFCQPMTTCFRIATDMDPSESDKRQIREALNKAYKKYQEEGKLCNPREDVLIFRGAGLGRGVIHFNSTRVIQLDPTDPFALSKAEMLGRKQIQELLGLLKESDLPALQNAHVISCASAIGVRESRKLKGEHILTADELIACTRFEDGIALGNYDIDIHNPTGSGTSHRYFAPGEYYTIPYRSLLPKEYDNLLVSGRCISATHEAQASIRIMPICATTGQAAGVAVAVAFQTGTNTHTLDIQEVRQRLRDAGAAVD